MINENTIVITQERMAGWLMLNRFHKMDEKLDLKDASRKIYIFKDTPELRDTMARYNQYKAMFV